jgi:hypothetical protein
VFCGTVAPGPLADGQESQGVIPVSPPPRAATGGGEDLVARGHPAPPRRVVNASAPRGFDWGDAGIGAAGGLGLSMIVLGGGLAVTGTRRHRRYATPR